MTAEPKIIWNVRFGVQSLSVEEMRFDPATGILSFEETFPGKTYPTQYECDMDWRRINSERMRDLNDARLIADLAAGAFEPKRPWWRFWG